MGRTLGGGSWPSRASSGIAAAGALHSATKLAQSNLAEGLRVEAREIGVEVTVVYPMVMKSEFREAMRDHLGGRSAARIRSPRQSAAEVAEAIVDTPGVEEPQTDARPRHGQRT